MTTNIEMLRATHNEDMIKCHCLDCEWEGNETQLDVDGENDSVSYWANFYCPKCHSENIEREL